jgi:hypothetical protein
MQGDKRDAKHSVRRQGPEEDPDLRDYQDSQKWRGKENIIFHEPYIKKKLLRLRINMLIASAAMFYNASPNTLSLEFRSDFPFKC